MKRRILYSLFLLSLLALIPSTAQARPAIPTKYFALLRVVYAGSVDNKIEILWEAAAPTKVTPDLQLYDAAIWGNAVALYRFDATFDADKSITLPLEQYLAYRNSYRLIKIDIPAGLDGTQRSHLLGDAFGQFFGRIMADAVYQHYGITYSGHGSGPGWLFSNNINAEDSRLLLESMTSALGRRLDFLDLGTTCSEGKVKVVSSFYPYFEYIMASDLLVGGYSPDEGFGIQWMESTPDYSYPLVLKPTNTIYSSLVQIMDRTRKRWEYGRNDMTTHQVKQSLSLFKTDAFDALAAAVAPALQAQSISELYAYEYDLYTYIKSLGQSAIENKFLALRVEYRSNKDFFPWDTDTNGLYIFDAEEIFPEVSLVAPTAPLRIVAGTTARVDLLIRGRNAFNSPVTLTAGTLPPLISATLPTVAGPYPQHAAMSVATIEATPAWSYSVEVTASGGGSSHSATVSIQVVRGLVYLPVTAR